MEAAAAAALTETEATVEESAFVEVGKVVEVVEEVVELEASAEKDKAVEERWTAVAVGIKAEDNVGPLVVVVVEEDKA